MESQVDIVSSIETESPERAGDTKLLQGTKAGARLGTWTVAGTGTLCFGLVLLSRRGTGGAGLMEADFTAETRMELALRAFAKDGFFKGTAEVAEFNFAPVTGGATFPRAAALPAGAATTLVKQAIALDTLAWDNIIGFRSYCVGLRDRSND